MAMPKTHKGTMCISRAHSNVTGESIHIQIEDEASGCRVIDGYLSLEAFASAVTCGRGELAFQHFSENVGKERETRDIVVPRPPHEKNKDGTGWVRKHAAHELTDGWRVHSESDVFNSHRWTKDGNVRVTLIRFVDPTN